MSFESDLRVVGCGHSEKTDVCEWGPGVRSVYIIHYIISGRGYVRYKDKCYSLEAGESFLVRPYSEIYYCPDNEDPWEYIWVDFTGTEAEMFIQNISLAPGCPVIGRIEQDNILPVYSKINQCDSYKRRTYIADGYLRVILGIYMETFPKTSESEREKHFSAAVGLVERHYQNPEFGVAFICEALLINRITLYRLFISETGISPTGYITEYRIKQAEKMLKYGSSVKNTAFSCGFSDPFYFSKIFKKYKGVPPVRYRSWILQHPEERQKEM